jgi:hypothetical protein
MSEFQAVSESELQSVEGGALFLGVAGAAGTALFGLSCGAAFVTSAFVVLAVGKALDMY